jgi:FAD/FMN-containing dehydrogenase
VSVDVSATGAQLQRFKEMFDGASGRQVVIPIGDASAGYLEDARGGHGNAAAMVAPRSTQEVSTIVQAATRCGLRLIAQGANTGLVAAGVAADAQTDVVLSLRGLNRPPQIDVANRSVRVDAGVLLSKLNAAAAEHGLWFPIDLASDPSVGGLIAANAAGARFVRYGDVRRNLLGLEVVLPDEQGTVLDLMNPLWKNNTALDLKQLFVGSSGSLGVITAAQLALHPRPAVCVCAVLVPADASAVVEALLALEHCASGALTAFEGMSRAAMQAALDAVPSLRNPFFDTGLPEFAVLVELSAGAGDTEGRLTELLSDALAPLVEGDVPRLSNILIGDAHRLWALRHAIPEGLRKRGSVIACDISVTRGQWAPLRSRLIEALRGRWPDLEVCDFGHVGDGGLHFNLVWPARLAQLPAREADAIRAQVFEIVVDEFGGAFSAEHGIGPRNLAYYQRFTDTKTRALSGALQRLLAPAGLGRVRFG